MTDCIIAMQSATLAKKAERAISSQGIACKLVSIDPSMTRRGCGYGIALSCRHLGTARDILERKRITHGDIIGAYSAER